MVSWDNFPISTIIVMMIGAIFFIIFSAFIFESLEETWSFKDSIYFVITTMCTIGYGDYSPTNKQSKLFTIIFIFSSLFLLFAIFHVVIGYCVNRQVSKIKKRAKQRRNTIDDALYQNDSNCHCCCLCNVCGRFFAKCCAKLSSLIIYLTLYGGWLFVWIMYFSDWNSNEAENFDFFNALYFGIITSSTVGYGDQTPTDYDINGKPYYDSRIFVVCWSILGVIFLALLANELSNGLLWFILQILTCPCIGGCTCCHKIITTQDELQLSRHAFLEIKNKGAIDFRRFLETQFIDDDQFQEKLIAASNLFDKLDRDGDKQIEFAELKVKHLEEKAEKLRKDQSTYI